MKTRETKPATKTARRNNGSTSAADAMERWQERWHWRQQELRYKERQLKADRLAQFERYLDDRSEEELRIILSFQDAQMRTQRSWNFSETRHMLLDRLHPVDPKPATKPKR